MQFGITTPISSASDNLSPSEAWETNCRYYETALRSGFECVSFGHHLVEGPGIRLFQPLPAAAAIMARFPALYVLTSAFCFPYHGAVQVAQEVATLDAISPGAFLFGVGQGYAQKGADAAGIDQHSRARRLAEGIAVCRLLWRDPPASFKGEFCSFDDADIGFRPQNKVGPPILIAADRPRTIARIPEIGGDYWLASPRHGTPFIREGLDVYKRALDAAGKEYRGIVIQRDVSLAETKAEADDAIRASYERMMKYQHDHGQPQSGLQNDRPYDDLKDERVLTGTPAQIAEEIIVLQRITGTGYIHLRVHTLGGSLQRSLEAIEQLGAEVLPAVKSAVKAQSLFPDRRSRPSAVSSTATRPPSPPTSCLRAEPT